MELLVNNISKSFKNIIILKDVNLCFKSGKIYCFYGKNGSGKSVLLKIICGLYKPDNGEILFDNKNYNLNNMFAPNLRALIEKPSFFPNLSGFENLKLLANIQNKITDDEILDALKKVNLFDDKDKKYSKYSLGMKQKLGIAQVIMEDPSIIILDEPFNGIDVESTEKIINIIKELKRKNKLIIITTHDKDELNMLSDETIYFNNGHVETKLKERIVKNEV